MDGESTLLHHTECPCGTSSDGLAVYDDGHGFCFRCDEYISAKKMGELGLSDEYVETATQSESQPKDLLRGTVEALAKRRITEETARKWGYIRAPFNGRSVHVAQFFDDNRRVVAQKLRLPNKDFIWRGDKKAAPGLYGKWLWKEGGRKIVITEGEIDALTVSQLQDNKWPVVSLVDGAGSAVKCIKKELQYLNSFDEVILMFDMDEPGQEAVEKVVGLFKPGKCFVASLPEKDANECLLQGKGKEVINAIWNAKEYRPDGILDAAQMWDEFIKEEDIRTIEYPWASLNVKTMGLRQRELVTLAACNPPAKAASSDQIQARQAEALAREAAQRVGTPAITNFTEKRLVRWLYELRDQPNYRTYSYIVNLNGDLIKICDSVGYGINASIQFSNPQKLVDGVDLGQYRGNVQMPQAEPNGLFMPEGLAATYVMCVDGDSEDVKAVYVEPEVIVSPFPLD